MNLLKTKGGIYIYFLLNNRVENNSVIKVTTDINGAEAAIFLMGNTGNLCQKHCQLSQLNITSPRIIQQMCVSYTDCGRSSTGTFGLQE